jgi:hypothetical protein
MCGIVLTVAATWFQDCGVLSSGINYHLPKIHARNSKHRLDVYPSKLIDQCSASSIAHCGCVVAGFTGQSYQLHPTLDDKIVPYHSYAGHGTLGYPPLSA